MGRKKHVIIVFYDLGLHDSVQVFYHLTTTNEILLVSRDHEISGMFNTHDDFYTETLFRVDKTYELGRSIYYPGRPSIQAK